MSERIRNGRRVRTVVAVVTAALGLASCGVVGTSTARLDAQFVEAVLSDGRPVPADAEERAALVMAARKICARRTGQVDPVKRHRSALTLRELDAVADIFAGDGRRFAALALDTYCPP